jgi:hypothetical protein
MPFQFPVIFAGQDLTAGTLQDMVPLFVVTPAATTRASTTIQASDPYLSFPVTAGGLYLVEFFVMYAGVSAAGISTSWIMPSGTSGYRTVLGPGTSSAASSNAGNVTSVNLAGAVFSTVLSYGCVTNIVTAYQNLRETATFTAASTGTCSFAWSQTSSSVTGTVVQAGSWGRMYELQ